MSASLATLRRHFLREKLRGYTLITTGAYNGSAYVGKATGTDAKRNIVSFDLSDQAVDGGDESDLPSGQYDNAWAYVPALGVQRRIPRNGYTAAAVASDVTDQVSMTSDYVGVITVAQPFTAALNANQYVELSTRLPILDARGLAGVHTILNRALRRMAMPSRIALTGVSGQTRYSLSSYPWITKQDQLIRVIDTEDVSGVDPRPLRGNHRIRISNQTAYLILDNNITTGTAFSVDLWRPIGSWIKVGGTWAESTAGLVNESDEAQVDPDNLAIVAYYYACDELAEHGPDGEKGTWASRRDRAMEAAYPLIRWQHDTYDDPSNDAPVFVSDGFSLKDLGGIGWP